MFWVVSQVLPRLRAELCACVGLTIAGARRSRALAALADRAAAVELLGRVDDLTPLYEQARLFVAPTRFPAGLPYKVHHAAAHGLPVVCTTLLAEQLGWRSGDELLAADDAAGFAAAC